MRPSPLVLVGALALAACGGQADSPRAAQEPAISSEAETNSPPELIGAWTVEYIGDRPVIDRSPAFLGFDAEGRVTGSATCNRMTGDYTQEGPALVFGTVAVTRRMCPEALMEQEQRLLAALEEVARWRVENGMLVLEDADGVLVARASPREVEVEA